MSALKLSKADSAAFRKLLRAKQLENKWTLAQVAAVLTCSRKTAWNYLQPGCKTRVRGVYAACLACHAKAEDVTWTSNSRVTIGTAAILAAWAKCTTAAARRKQAYRLAIFISECAILLYGIPTTTLLVATDINAEPDSVTVTLMLPRTRICGSLLIHFERNRPSKLLTSFCDSSGKVVFKGILSKDLLPKLFNKLKSWQRLRD